MRIYLAGAMRGHHLFNFPVLATFSGDRGAKQIIRSHPEAVLELAVDDPGIHMDLDTREDMDAL